MTTSRREEALKAATDAVASDRNKVYGSPTSDFSRTAKMASVLLGHKLTEEITPEEVAKVLICVKLSRLVETPSHDDSWVDIAGYAACGAECTQDCHEG